MQSCRFDNFQVLPENRTAHERCLRVANLEEGVASPLVLMGPHGQGKTHLLWSIVNHVRDRHPQTALALITPREFPIRVRALARNPEPIQKSRHAILLVDSLPQFRQDAIDLEGVIAAFLDNHFSVVIATQQPPIQLEAFSADFRRRLTSSDVVSLGGRSGNVAGLTGAPAWKVPDSPDAARLHEIEARNNTLVAERDAAATRLERSQRRVVQLEEEIAALLQKYAALEGSERQSRDASRELVRLQGEHEAMRVEIETARAEREAARAAVRQHEADNQSLREEMGRSRDLPLQLTQARDERDAARSQLDELAQQATLLATELEAERDTANQLRGQLEAVAGVEQQLSVVQSERDAAIEEARRMAEQAAAVLDHLVASRPDAADANNESYALIAEFLERLREQRGTADLDLSARLEAIAAGEESAAQRTLRSELAEVASEREMQASLYEEARAGQARIDVELGLAQGRLRELKRERDVARQTHTLVLSELDALREQTREELASARRELAALRWHVEALAQRMADGGESREVAEALAALATHEPVVASTAAVEEEPQLFEEVQGFNEAHKGRALLREISRQLADTSRTPEGGEAFESTAQSDGPLTRAVEQALSWDEPGYPT